MEKKKRLEHWQMVAIVLAVYDAIVVNLSYGLTLWLRFDMQYNTIPDHYLEPWFRFIPIYTVFCLVVFWFLRLYKSLWEFASYFELSRIALSSVITGALSSRVAAFFSASLPTILPL